MIFRTLECRGLQLLFTTARSYKPTFLPNKQCLLPVLDPLPRPKRVHDPRNALRNNLRRQSGTPRLPPGNSTTQPPPHTTLETLSLSLLLLSRSRESQGVNLSPAGARDQAPPRGLPHTTPHTTYKYFDFL